MPYVEWHDNIRHHHKTDTLARLLRIPPYAALGLRGALYAWSIGDRPGGRMGRALVPIACRWGGDPERLVKAMVEARLLDEVDANTVQIHDWQDYTKGYRKVRQDIERRRSATDALQSRDNSATAAGSGAERNREERRGEERPSFSDPIPTPTPSLEGGPLDHLHTVARSQKIAGRPETIRQYVEAWYARVGASKTEEMLMASTGFSVMEIQDRYFGKNGKTPASPTLGLQKKSAKQAKCETCQTTGSVVVQWEQDGEKREGVKPCPQCSRESAHA